MKWKSGRNPDGTVSPYWGSDGTYTITVATVCGEKRYGLWRLPRTLIGIFDTKEAAKAAAEKEA